MKKIYALFKKLVFGIFFLYGFNVLSAPLDLFIPINWITIVLFMIFGIPSIFALIVIKLLLF